MKSKAVVGFPIALFTGTIVLELAHVGTHDAFYYLAAMVANIAALVMALFATITPSPVRATGIKNAAFSLLTIAVFGISAVLLVRGWTSGALDAHIPLALGMIGIVSMTFAGAFGYSQRRSTAPPLASGST